MREIKAMTKRNLLIYFRNKSAVFFSILSALILLAIMVVFLGESSSEGLLDALNQYGTGTAEENANPIHWEYIGRAQRKMQKMPRGWFNCGSWVVFWVLTA